MNARATPQPEQATTRKPNVKLKAGPNLAMNSPDTNLKQFLGFDPAPSRYESDTTPPWSVAFKVASLIQPNSRILDIGCGTGATAAYLIDRREADLTGIEPSLERAKIAAAKGINVLAKELSESMLLEIGTFDYILFLDVLEHVPDPGSLACLAKKFLKPKGSLIVSVPNVAHWSVRLNLLRGKFDYKQVGILDATHLRWFTGYSIATWAHRCGFKIVSQSSVAGPSLDIYNQIPLFKRLSDFRRAQLLNPLADLIPGLFSCQFILELCPDNSIEAHIKYT
jgi:methionine biosynthesis protein MetW